MLSRPVRTVSFIGSNIILGKTKEEIRELQCQEKKLKEMVDFIEGECIPKNTFPKCTLDQFVEQEGILYYTRVKPDGSVYFVLVIPQSLKQAALNFAHITLSGHLGQYKTMLKVEDYFY